MSQGISAITIGMKIVALNCNRCGASLEVGAKAKFVTCAYCNAQLQIHHTSNAHFSEVLGEIQATTNKLSDDVAELKKHGELERLDREWESQRKRYMIQGKHGNYQLPTVIAGVFLMIFGVGFGIVWTLTMPDMSGLHNPSWIMSLAPYFGLGIAAISIGCGIHVVRLAKVYEAARQEYQRKRKVLRSG